MWFALMPLSAVAWTHTHRVHVDPLTLEVTTQDAVGAPPGAVQDALALALADWTDDACLETLPPVTLVDTDDNVLDSDERNTVSVDLEPATHANAVAYSYSRDSAFTRFGHGYSIPYEVDIEFRRADWETVEGLDDGSCDGPLLERAAYEMVAFTLGVQGTWTLEEAPGSLWGQDLCDPPVIGDDDRAGLQALYGSGVDVVCDDEIALNIGYDTLTPLLDDCHIETYGSSLPLGAVWIADGVAAADPSLLRFDTPGRHAVEVCGTFDVHPDCDRPEACVPVDREFLVCETPDPVLSWVLQDGGLDLTDDSALTEDICAFSRRWTLRRGDEVLEVYENSTRLGFVTLPEPGTYEIELELLAFEPIASVVEVVVWEDDAVVDGIPEGCGCATSGAPVGALPLLALLWLRRRRSR